jgi:hypothetical protein
MTTHPQKITFGKNARQWRPRCADPLPHHCSHHIEVSADRWPDHITLRISN